MQITDRSNITRWGIVASSFLIVVMILWNTYRFFNIFKEDERRRVELWALAQHTINNSDENTPLDLPLAILESNKTVPMIVTDNKGAILKTKNIPEEVEKDTVRAKQFLESIKKDNTPIRFRISQDNYQYLYYGNSQLLNNLKYFPVTLVFIVVLFAAIVFIFYRASKMATENRLWAGMAKETAHQIGTPLSSLLGWIEIMKADNVDETTVAEVEKDVHRLQTIAERFSKIGSEPVLAEKDIVEETAKTFEYLKSRASNQIEFSFKAPDHPVRVMLNPELHSWTIENLVKNAIDAMRGRGRLSVIIEEKENIVKIKVCDSGKGIPKAQFKKVFEPGFTTKKRGWGLGLSLTRRIVEEYHKGRIKVLSSELGKGTIMQASYKTVH